MTRMRDDRHPSSSDLNKEDKEGGGNIGSLPSKPELESNAPGEQRHGHRRIEDDLGRKGDLNRQQAHEIGNPRIDESGNQKSAP